VIIGDYFGRKVHVVPGALAKGGTLRRCPDIGKLEKLGYMPKISFKEGLNKTAKWYDEYACRKPEVQIGE
jgi:UDP-glucose 4-epimerase